MEKLTFQQLNDICHANADKKYVADCLQIVKHQSCIFETGIIMPHQYIASLYSLRFENAKKSGKLSRDYLMDYEICVDQLNKSNSEFLGITSVYSDNFSFLIFYEPYNKIILGVLRSNNTSGLKGVEENATETVNRGFSSNAEKYIKGVFTRDWK